MRALRLSQPLEQKERQSGKGGEEEGEGEGLGEEGLFVSDWVYACGVTLRHPCPHIHTLLFLLLILHTCWLNRMTRSSTRAHAFESPYLFAEESEVDRPLVLEDAGELKRLQLRIDK